MLRSIAIAVAKLDVWGEEEKLAIYKKNINLMAPKLLRILSVPKLYSPI